MTHHQHELIPETALRWHREGRGAILVTVVDTWGAAPRAPGSQMVVSGAGETEGSVCGGCVEGSVVAEAIAALQSGQARLKDYTVSDATAMALGHACGGALRLLLEPVGPALPESLLEDLVTARLAHRPVTYAVDLQSWSRALLGQGVDALSDARLRSDRAGLEEDGRFLVPHNPPLRLVVVGAVNIAQTLVTMAGLAGYDVTVIDPRPGFGSAARFPGTVLLRDPPQSALEALGPDSRSAIVTLSHDPELDDAALRLALRSPAFYVGSLGSGRSHARRLERLRAEGFSETDTARIHGPVGLSIGARSPAEIAIAILAEITQALRQG